MTAPLTCIYVTDRTFLACTCFSVRTLIVNATIPLTVHILHTGIDREAIAEAEGYLRPAIGTGTEVVFTEMPPAEFSGLPKPQSLPSSSYGRLLVHKILPDLEGRVLYLDGDTLVDLDVAPLAVFDLDGAAVGAVVDVGRILAGRREEAQRRLGLGSDGDYFNSGVLLIDWEKWRELEIGERCLSALMEMPARFIQGDQCALNLMCHQQWAKLDPAWNYQPADVLFDDRDRAIFHFLGGRKPWVPGHLRHPARFVLRYREMYQSSPWADAYHFGPGGFYLCASGARDIVRAGKDVLSRRYWRNKKRYELFRSR